MAGCSVLVTPPEGTGPSGDLRTHPPPAGRAGRARPRRPPGRGPADLRQRDGLSARYGPPAPLALAGPRPQAGLARGGVARPGGPPPGHRIRLYGRAGAVVVRGGPARPA